MPNVEREVNKLRVGVIGAGAFAEACHVPGLQSHPQVQVVALCGRRYAHARAMADRLNVPDVHTDFHELCARSDLDAVTIATPNVEHARQACAALESSKHVFCEKPLAMTVPEAREMVRVAEATGKVHQVGFTFRYGYGVRELRHRLRQGDVGKPYYLRIQYDSWDGIKPDGMVGWREKQSLAGGGMLFDVGSHLFDIARYILGPIESVMGFLHHVPRQRTDLITGKPTSVETDDLAAAWFCYSDGVRGQWFISRVTPPFADNGYVEVVGPEGALKASLSRGGIDLLKGSNPGRPAWRALPLPEQAQYGKRHNLSLMMRSFADACLRGKLDGEMDASFHDGLAVQLGLDAILESNRCRTWIDLKHVTLN
jgi:levoglucosan dehydrogenase